MAKVGPLIKRQLARFEKRHASTGLLYNGRYPAKQIIPIAKTHAVFVSDEGGVMYREHTFKKEHKNMTPAEWWDWFADHYAVVLDNILETYADRFGGTWGLHTFIGFSDASHKTRRTKVAKRRNKTKRKGKRNVR